MQQLSVSLSIPIPEDKVLISKVQLEELEKQKITGMYWSMRDLEERTGKKSEWIKERILYPEKFRRKLDVEFGGFVYYPKSKGQTWTFQATKMAEFLENNFHRIFKEVER